MRTFKQSSLRKKRMRALLLWVVAGIASALVTLLAFFPAAWLVPVVEAQTNGRITLGDAQGTVWQGSAFIGGAAGTADPVTPLLPGRFSWNLSPLALLGQVEFSLENAAALSQPI